MVTYLCSTTSSRGSLVQFLIAIVCLISTTMILECSSSTSDTITVDVLSNRRAISPLIYGMNFISGSTFIFINFYIYKYIFLDIILYYIILYYCYLFYSILFYSILFYSILFY